MRNLRTYLAGLGSSGALVGAVIAGFLALGAIVGFNGLPSSSADSKSGAVVVEDSNAPEIAAAAAAGPAGAPAPTPTDLAADGPGGPGAAPGAAAPAGTGSGDETISGADTIDVPDVAGGDGGGGSGTVPQTEPTPAPAPATGTNEVGGLVDEVDETVTDSTGLELDLGGKTGDVTDVVDGAVGGLTGERDVNLPDLKP